MRQIETGSNLLMLSNQVQGVFARVTSGDNKEQSEAYQDMAQLPLERYGSVDFINQKYLLDKNNRALGTQAAMQLTEDVTCLVSHAQDKHAYAYWGSYDNGVGQQNVEAVRAIIDRNSNRQFDSLVLIVRPTHFSTILSDVAMGSGMQICTLDVSNGVIIRVTDALNDIGTLPEPSLPENLACDMTSGKVRSFVAVEGKRGGRYLTVYAKIPDTTWFVASTIAEKKLMAEMQTVRNQVALVGISGVLLSIFLTYFISHNIPTPLGESMCRVRDTEDDAGAQVDEEKHMEAGARVQDELSRLAQRSERMCEAIEQKIQKINEINVLLEQTVIERTAELVMRGWKSRILIENSPDTITHYDHESRRTYANPVFCILAGCSLMKALGKQPSKPPGGDDARVYKKIISDIIPNGTSAQFELGQAGRNG